MNPQKVFDERPECDLLVSSVSPTIISHLQLTLWLAYYHRIASLAIHVDSNNHNALCFGKNSLSLPLKKKKKKKRKKRKDHNASRDGEES